MEAVFENDILTISVEGRIDSLNSEDLQKRLFDALLQYGAENVVIDANRLSYISSAGLRVLLKFRKKIKGSLKIVGVSDEVYDIFSITGFVDMFDIERKIRSVRIGDSVRINSALNGSIYQLSKDEIIKIYGRNVPLSEIKKERDYSRAAMISGIPTLIPYDVVESEYGYGIVFEKADAVSLTRLIRENSGNLNIYATWLARFMQEVHGTEIEPDRLPDIKDRYNKWIAEVSEGDRDSARIMSTLIESIPDSNNYVHGDMNLGKILVKDGELLLFDMAGSARGNAIFDLQNIYATLVGIENNTQGYCRKKYSLSAEVCHNFWDEFIYRYYKGDSAMVQKMNDIMRKYYILTEKVLNAVSDRYKKSAAALFENRRPS